MRMLQVPELKRAMGIPASYLMNRGTRRERVKLLGNGVCPPVMEAVVRSLTSASRDPHDPRAGDVRGRVGDELHEELLT